MLRKNRVLFDQTENSEDWSLGKAQKSWLIAAGWLKSQLWFAKKMQCFNSLCKENPTRQTQGAWVEGNGSCMLLISRISTSTFSQISLWLDLLYSSWFQRGSIKVDSIFFYSVFVIWQLQVNMDTVGQFSFPGKDNEAVLSGNTITGDYNFCICIW